jgi:ssDNA-binding Zn-finger/Zn-ribbon topoisomerase 1
MFKKDWNCKSCGIKDTAVVKKRFGHKDFSWKTSLPVGNKQTLSDPKRRRRSTRKRKGK